ncbi:hypothetical protein D3C87_759830 [compost metagenome]
MLTDDIDISLDLLGPIDLTNTNNSSELYLDIYQNNTDICNTIQYNTDICNTIQYNTDDHNTIQYNTDDHNTIQYNTDIYNTDSRYYPSQKQVKSTDMGGRLIPKSNLIEFEPEIRKQGRPRKKPEDPIHFYKRKNCTKYSNINWSKSIKAASNEFDLKPIVKQLVSSNYVAPPRKTRIVSIKSNWRLYPDITYADSVILDVIKAIKIMDSSFSLKKILVIEETKVKAKKSRYYKLCKLLLRLPRESIKFSYSKGGIAFPVNNEIIFALEDLPELYYSYSTNCLLIHDLRLDSTTTNTIIRDIFFTMRMLSLVTECYDIETLQYLNMNDQHYVSNSFVYQNNWTVSGIFGDVTTINDIMLKMEEKETHNNFVEYINIYKRILQVNRKFNIKAIHKSVKHFYHNVFFAYRKYNLDLMEKIRLLPLIYIPSKDGVLITSMLYYSLDYLDVPNIIDKTYSKESCNRNLVYEYFAQGGRYGKYKLNTFNIEAYQMLNSEIYNDACKVITNLYALYKQFGMLDSIEIRSPIVAFVKYTNENENLFQTLFLQDKFDDNRNMILYDPNYV